MSGLQHVIAGVAGTLLVVVFAGLFVRRRYEECLTFALYIGAVILAEFLILLWPAHFYTWECWVLSEIVHNLLKFGIALELAVRTFRVFPGATATARRLLFLVVVVTGCATVTDPLSTPDYLIIAGDLHGRILHGTMWLFLSLTAVILWYRLPVSSFHKAILLGFVPYLLIFTLAMNLFRSFGWVINEYVGYLHSLAYVALLLYWTSAVWKPRDPATERR